MHNLRNIVLAWLSTSTCFAAAIETGALISVISSIVLPFVFFTGGKLIDLALQLYLLRRDRSRSGPLDQARTPH